MGSSIWPAEVHSRGQEAEAARMVGLLQWRRVIRNGTQARYESHDVQT